MAVLSNSNAISPSGYDINNSLRFRASATAYLQRTPASASNRRTFTLSTWVKRGLAGGTRTLLSVNQNSSYGVFDIIFGLDAADDLGVYQNSSGTNTLRVATAAVFRDYSAWYHVVAAIDTTQATAADRVKIYVNGVQQTVNIGNQVPLNTDLWCNNTMTHNIGKEQTLSGGSGGYLDGYLAEYHFIDGQALTPSSFGETDAVTGVWKAKKYTGTYGTNGFYLKFSDIATTSGSNAGLGKDFSGNTNYWTTNNISVTSGTTYDAMTDVPTNTSATVANYAVLNPLALISPSTLANGNLQSTTGTTGGGGIYNTIAFPNSGKFYFEYISASGISSDNGRIGISNVGNTQNVWYLSDGTKKVDSTISAYGATWTNNDVIGVAVNIDSNSVTFYKNNTNQGSITYTISDKTMFTYTEDGSGVVSVVANWNFGQQPFTYTPPTGFVALNTYNLPDSTIKKGNSYMDATLYTGNTTGQTITNAGAFKPDFVWLKDRTNAYSHVLTDSVRGVSKQLFTNLTNAETTEAGKGVTSFNSNGFTLGGELLVTGSSNNNGDTYVGWQWQAGQGSTSSNTSGSITSTVSVNTTAGFSVVTYTGTGALGTVGHGLGVAPSMLIIKSRSAIDTWRVYHASLGNTKYINLNDTSAAGTASTVWNNTSPTSSVFTINTESSVNGSGRTQVAYCWAEIAGFSKFGSYTGNGSTDGPFIFTGFRPKFVMIKCTSNADSWYMLDTSRSTYNATNQRLFANASSAESSGDAMDILSNGFKNRSNTTINNLNGGTYIYMAFAENPFKNSLAR